MLKLKNPLPKRNRTIRTYFEEKTKDLRQKSDKAEVIRKDIAKEKANKARQENERNRTIAKNYFSQAPSLPNLAKGAYYWILGNITGESEDPADYEYVTGTAPVVGIGKALLVVKPGGARVVKEVIGLRPKPVTKVVQSAKTAFEKGVERGKKMGYEEGVVKGVETLQSRVSRAYKLGKLRATRALEKELSNTLKRVSTELDRVSRAYKLGQQRANLTTAMKAGKEADKTTSDKRSTVSQIFGWSKASPDRGFIFSPVATRTMNTVKVATPLLGVADVASNIYTFFQNPLHKWTWNPFYTIVGNVPTAYNRYVTNRNDSVPNNRTDNNLNSNLNNAQNNSIDSAVVIPISGTPIDLPDRLLVAIDSINALYQ